MKLIHSEREVSHVLYTTTKSSVRVIFSNYHKNFGMKSCGLEFFSQDKSFTALRFFLRVLGIFLAPNSVFTMIAVNFFDNSLAYFNEEPFIEKQP